MTTDVDRGIWADLVRPVPAWLGAAKLGIFIHWGPYSVPAWAEPTGPLGAVPETEWFRHNPYAEWYANTIRIPGSPAAQHHLEVFGDAPYDDFLDEWTASNFDPAAWARLFAEAGASYVIPTTKHHDGVALWDAPGTGSRNTVHRGPRRDLVGEIADAVRQAGLRFGVYYSGGLDWGVTDFPPLTGHADFPAWRPKDAAYNAYASLHVRDLVARYSPDVLWNDINWPDAGKRTGSWSLHELFSDYYAGNPDGVVNDRWGDTHWDFRTSEYEAGREKEAEPGWENCRGIGFSFGYNRAEDERHILTGRQLACHLTDVVSRGGRLLLNVGPTAEGEIPELQQVSLRSLGRWMAQVGDLLRTSHPVDPDVARPTNEPWVRWLDTPDHLVALVDQTGETPLDVDKDAVTAGEAEMRAAPGTVQVVGGRVRVSVGELTDGPVAVLLPKQ
jgi:alpha-L-fucosidase